MKINKIIPLNRVEGDLEIHLQIDDGRVTDARSVGTMYRGFENLLIGRAPLDSLVITPRICGICSTAHLLAAASALDMAYHAAVPGNAWRIRNATLMVEQLQNDIRQSYLLFMPDLAHPAYAQNPMFDEAVQRYEPMKGQTALQAISETKKILEIIALFFLLSLLSLLFWSYFFSLSLLSFPPLPFIFHLSIHYLSPLH